MVSSYIADHHGAHMAVAVEPFGMRASDRGQIWGLGHFPACGVGLILQLDLTQQTIITIG
jgi:hypothetical protein